MRRQSEPVVKPTMPCDTQGFSSLTFCRFKMKVGSDLSDDIRRARIFREEIGWDNFLVSVDVLL